MARGASTAKKESGSMPGKKRPAEHYESDDGFVANDGSDTNAGPKAKKAKKEAKAKRKLPSDEKKEQFWELSDRRRVSVNEFNGQTLVNIREYYEKDGQMLPGKKGISLTMPQFNALLALLPELEAVLAAKGETVERPAYNAKPIPSTDGANDEPEAEAEAENEEPSTKAEEKSKKKNFEATSEEGE
ncbi:hypothetical protein G7Y79_00077g099650 [Physcia stellaris]|nr:hypothetical protein G7Y79_00077g099650 [Physcia stellaris]